LATLRGFEPLFLEWSSNILGH